MAPVPDWYWVGATSCWLGPVYGNVEVRREVGETATLGSHDERRVVAQGVVADRIDEVRR